MDLDDELASLVEEIGGMGSNSKPAPAAPSTTQQKKPTQTQQQPAQEINISVDDLDSFLLEMEEEGPAKRRATAPTKKPQIKRKGKYSAVGAAGGQELDILLGGLEDHVSKLNLNDGSKGTCSFCNQPILGDMSTILERNFHPEHVFCSNCKKREPHQKYFNSNGQILCPACHGARTGFICAHCNEPILERCVNALDKHWHPEHFKCTKCGSGFPDGKYHEVGGRPFCAKCFGSSTICKSCSKPIEGQSVNALGGTFHKECFGCPVCKKPFGPGFYQYQGLPYCEKHYLEKMGIPFCGGCNQPISSGKFLTAMGQKWHPEHFCCSFCTKPLSPDFKTDGKKAYCEECFGAVGI